MSERPFATEVGRARFAATVAVFGAVWGAAEMSVGAFLHAARFPLKGVVLTALGLTIALAARRIYDARGLVLTIGIVAATLKLLSFAAVSPLNAAIAIAAEAAIAEAVLGITGGRRIGFAAAGALAALFPLPFFVLGQALLFGDDVLVRYARLVEWGVGLFGLPAGAAVTAIGVLAAMHAAAGAVAGLAAWSLASLALRRMGRVPR